MTHITQENNITKTISLALVDDHVLLRKGLANMLSELGFKILIQADHGQSLIHALHPGAEAPDMALLDIQMPVMDGYATAHWLQQHYPSTRILVLSMNDDEASIIRMLRSGARGYVLKDCEPQELYTAIHSLYEKGFYHSELVSARLLHNLLGGKAQPHGLYLAQDLSTREREFLQFCCTELTYKEIADKLGLSPRTIDGYRDELFAKLGVKSRVGLVLYAIKQGLVKL